MLLLISKNTFIDGSFEFCIELVFKKTDQNLYSYQSGVLKSLYEDDKISGLPTWTTPASLDILVRIFQNNLSFSGENNDWFLTTHCVDNGFKEYIVIDKYGDFKKNLFRYNKTYNSKIYEQKMIFSGIDFLIRGQLNFCFESKNKRKFKDVVCEIFSQKQFANKPLIAERKFWLLDLEQFKSVDSIAALNSDGFDRLLYPQKRESKGERFAKINTQPESSSASELDYKKRAREFYQRKHYKQPIKKSDIVNLSKFNYEISNLDCSRFGDCSNIDLSNWGGDFEPDAYFIDSYYYGYSDYDSNTRCDSCRKSHDFFNYQYNNWVSDKNTLYYDGDKNTFEGLERNLVSGFRKIKLNRARKLVNKRLNKESSDISQNRRSGGWKESSKKRKQWMK